MPSGFRNISGIDFDDLFDPDVRGDGPQAAAFKRIDGAPLRYASIAHGSKGADVGFRDINNSDLSNLWAAKGTATYNLPINGQSFYISNIIPPGQMGSASIVFYAKADGTYEISYTRTHGFSPDPVTGTWLAPGASASDYEVRLSRTHTGGTAVASIPFNDAPSFASLTANRGFAQTVGPNGAQSGSRQSIDAVKVEIRRISTGAIQTTIFNTYIETDGSA